MIYLDGSYGEGGGQIIRSALSMSMVTGKAFQIKNIRAGRTKSGLLRQHLTAVNAAATISSACVEGNEIGSTALAFSPGTVTGGGYEFSISTAGSATLVLQTLLPALLTAKQPSTIRISGGTHNPFAPPYHFLEGSFMRCLKSMGFSVSSELIRYGFYPAGGGMITMRIEPGGALAPLKLTERGNIRSVSCTGIVSKIPIKIAKSETGIVGKQIRLDRRHFQSVDSPGPGNILFLEIDCEHVTEIISGFGEKGKPLEKVAQDVVLAGQFFLNSGVPVGEYLADQLLLPMLIAGGGRFNTTKPSLHTVTNAEIIKQFVDIPIVLDRKSDNDYIIKIGE